MVEAHTVRNFFTDRLLLLLSIINAGLAFLVTIRVLLAVQQYDYKIAVRYTEYGIDRFPLGDWFTHFELAVFAVVTTAIAIALAVRLHALQRPISIVILMLHIVTLSFLFVVSNALLSTSSVAS